MRYSLMMRLLSGQRLWNNRLTWRLLAALTEATHPSSLARLRPTNAQRGLYNAFTLAHDAAPSNNSSTVTSAQPKEGGSWSATHLRSCPVLSPPPVLLALTPAPASVPTATSNAARRCSATLRPAASRSGCLAVGPAGRLTAAAAAVSLPCLLYTCSRAHGTSSASSTSAASAASPTSADVGTVFSSGDTAAAPAAAAAGASVDPREAAKFAALAASWWRSTDGPFAPLHALNPARVRFIRQSLAAAVGLDAEEPEPLAGLRVLDVGCGGGILSESLARLGAEVHGIDVTRENVEAARLHAARDPRVDARVRYDVISAEELASPGTSAYDVVIASEVLEHVSKPHQLLAVLSTLLVPPAARGHEEGHQPSSGDAAGGGGGVLIVSTLNRTPAAWAVAIAGAEYVARVVPAGTHQWRKFITPEELALMAEACGLQMWHAAGMAPIGPRMSWDLTTDLSVNYIAALRRRGSGDEPSSPPPPQIMGGSESAQRP